jgi:glycerol uptake facilitator-like aquaporin
MYIAAQMLGAMFGTFLVWLSYRLHFDATDDKDLKLAVFLYCTGNQEPVKQLYFQNSSAHLC